MKRSSAGLPLYPARRRKEEGEFRSGERVSNGSRKKLLDAIQQLHHDDESSFPTALDSKMKAMYSSGGEGSGYEKSRKKSSGHLMIEDISLQLKQIINRELAENEQITSERKQKLFEWQSQQFKKYQDHLKDYSQAQIPFLKKFHDDHTQSLNQQISNSTKSLEQEMEFLGHKGNAKGDQHEMTQFSQRQSENLITELEALTR